MKLKISSSISELKCALQIAKRAHEGQLRVLGHDIGQPYFDTHVMRVVKAVPDWAKPAAALHDVVEDTDITFQELLETSDLHNNTIRAVELLTRKEGEHYSDYIHNICQTFASVYSEDVGIIARRVKLADISDNLASAPNSDLVLRYAQAQHKILGFMLKQTEVSYE